VANLLMSFCGAGITVTLVPLIAEDRRGQDPGGRNRRLGGIGGIVGKFLSGWLLDRVQSSLRALSAASRLARWATLLLDMGHTRAELLLGTLCIGLCHGAGLQVSTLPDLAICWTPKTSASSSHDRQLDDVRHLVRAADRGGIHEATGSYAGCFGPRSRSC
jgi:hypothetical protein